MRETGASDINDPERIIDWFAKNQKFAKRTLLDRTLGLPDYEKAWQQFLTARAAAHSSAPGHVRSLSPETWLVKTLSEIDYEAFVRATKKVKGDHAIIDWFIKNEGLGTKKAYEQAWQNYLSSLAKERQEKQSQPVIAPFLPQPAVAPIPYQPGVIAPPAVAPIPHEPGALARGEPDPEQTVMQGVHPIFQETGVRGHVIGGGASPENTDNLVKHLFVSIGDKHSPQAKAFIGKLRTRLQALQNDNQPLRVGDFLDLVGRYANQEFGLVKGADIARTMAGLSTNNPNSNAVSSGQLRDDNRLDLSYLLRALQ